jgi:hypothetical protein
LGDVAVDLEFNFLRGAIMAAVKRSDTVLKWILKFSVPKLALPRLWGVSCICLTVFSPLFNSKTVSIQFRLNAFKVSLAPLCARLHGSFV